MGNATNEKRPLGDLFDPDDNGHDDVTQSVVTDEQESPPTSKKRTTPIPSTVDGMEKCEISLTENAIKVLERRYLKKNENSEVIETPVELFNRVARLVASADSLYDP